jgi:hypothetical protein
LSQLYRFFHNPTPAKEEEEEVHHEQGLSWRGSLQDTLFSSIT